MNRLLIVILVTVTACGDHRAAQSLDASTGADATALGAKCASTPTQLATAAEIAPAALGPVGVQVPYLGVTNTDLFFNVLYSGVNGQAAPTGHIMRVLLGTTTPQLFVDSPQPGRFALTDDAILFADAEAGIQRVPLTGGSASSFATATGAVTWVGADDHNLYFADTAGIESAPLTGGASHNLTSATAFSVALAGGSLVLADFTGGTISSVPITGGAVTPLATSQLSPLYPRSCGAGALCWLDAGDAGHPSSLVQLGTAPSAKPTVLAQGAVLYHPIGLAVDDSNFYVTTEDVPGAVVRIPVAGGAPQIIATINGTGDIALDDTCIYYSSFDGVFSLAKDGPAIE